MHNITLHEKIVAGRIADVEADRRRGTGIVDLDKSALGDKYLYKILKTFSKRKGRVKQEGALKGLGIAGFLCDALGGIVNTKIRYKQQARLDWRDGGYEGYKYPCHIAKYGYKNSRRNAYRLPYAFHLDRYDERRNFHPLTDYDTLTPTQLKSLAASEPLNYESLYAVDSKGYVVARQISSLTVSKLRVIFALMAELRCWKENDKKVFLLLNRYRDASTFFELLYPGKEEQEIPAAQRGKYTRMWNKAAEAFCRNLKFA